MSWLDNFFGGYRLVQASGVPFPSQHTLNLMSGFTVADDPANQRTNVTCVGTIAGGPAGTAITSSFSLASQTGPCIPVDLQASDVTCTVNVVAPYNGLVYVFDLLRGTNNFFLTGATFMAAGNAGTTVTTWETNNGGQQVIIKYNSQFGFWSVLGA